MSADEIPFLLAAIEAEPANWNTRRYLAEHFIRTGDEPKAVSLVTTASVPPDTEDHALFAAQLAATHSLKRAHQLADSFLINNASNARAHLLKAKFFELQGASDKAHTHQKVAAVLNPYLDPSDPTTLQVLPIQLEGFTEGEVIQMPDLDQVASRVKPLAPPAQAVAVATVTPDITEAPIAEIAPDVAFVRPEEAVVAEEPILAGTEAVEDDVAPPGSVVPLAPPTAAAAAAVVAVSEIVDEPVIDAAEAIAVAAEPEIAAIAPLEPAEAVVDMTMSAVDATDAAESVVDSVEAQGDGIADDDVARMVEKQTAMVAAMSDTSGEVLKKPKVEEVKKGSDKASAIAIAIVAHIAILALLWGVVVAIPQNKPPEIVASTSTADVDSDLKKSTVVKPQMQQQSAAAQKVQVISANMFSEVAMPSVDISTPTPSLGMGADMGMDFGMSFSSMGGGAGMSNIPPSMAGRCSMGQRMARLKESGATTKCESAVRNALKFIASNQNENGSFGKEYPAAITALAILAYLGHCETPDSPEFGDTVLRATQFLMERAKKTDHKDKAIMSEGGKAGYENAICTYALAEMYTMTKATGAASRIPRLLSSVKQGINAIVDGQVKSGGWDYGYRQGTGDSSVSGWQFQAMKAASNTGERFSGLDRAMDKAVDYFKFAQTADGGTAYRPEASKAKANRGLDGVGVLAMLMKGDEKAPEVAKAFEGMRKRYLADGKQHQPHAYGWYYIMQAYFLKGGDEWKDWNNMAMDAILAKQVDDGSFKVNGGHGPKEPNTAAIYHTALCTLMLEVYYRYLPTNQKNLGR